MSSNSITDEKVHDISAVADKPFAESSHNEDTVAPKLSRHGLPLVPQPSDDPFDPLNWPTIQKLVILAVLCIWTFQGPLNIITIAPAFFVVSEDLNCSLNVVTYLVGSPLLAYGVASLFWVGLGNRFGVRKCFVLSSLTAGLLSIWAAKAKNFASLTAARTLASAFMASPETLGPQVVADVFFLNDRAKCMALFALLQTSGFAIGSLQGAYITANLGWRWIEWVHVILALSCCLLLFLFFPETQYTRESAGIHARKRRLIDNLTFPAVSGGGRRKVDNFWRAFAYPFRYIPHPALLVMTFHFSVLLMITNYMLTSNTFIFEGEYGFDIKKTGLTALSPFLATCLAIPYSGYLNDWYVERNRHHKDFQPEWRLVFFAVTAVLAPVGCIVVGVTAQNHDHYVAVLIGEALIMFSFLVACNLTQTYLVDVYMARADAALVIQNGFKNFAAFGISYAIVPWNTSAGYAVPFGVLAVLAFVAHVPIGIMWWKGPQIRAWSAKIWKEARSTHHGDSF